MAISKTILNRYRTNKVNYEASLASQGETHYNTRAYKTEMDRLEKLYPGIAVEITNQATASSSDHSIEIKREGIRIHLNSTQISVSIDRKFKFTPEKVQELKDDLSGALDIVSQAAKLDPKLRVNTGVEI